MSWEIMSSKTTKCYCGKGSMTHVMEMDDWSRSRNSTLIHCPDCLKKAARGVEERQQKEAANEALYSEARKLAKDRYLRKWLDLYSGLTTRAAWQRYTGGSGYPALGTFYKHVKDAGGVARYMQRCFESDIETALRKMSIEDGEIDKLLSRRSKQPTGLVRHPYD